MSNILIIKHGSLGDIAQASGAIQDIYENHKDHNLYIMTSKPYIDLYKKSPFITDIILDKRLSRFNLIYLYLLMRKIKKLKFVKVFDLQNSSRTKFYRKFIFKNDIFWSGSNSFLSKEESISQKNLPVLTRMEQQLERSGISDRKFTKKPDLSWALTNIGSMINQNFEGKYILIFPFCSPKLYKKKWPYYKDLISLIKRDFGKEFNIAIAPGPNEINEAKKFNVNIILNNGLPLNINELISLINNSSYIVSNDTGPAHICAHLNKKGVVLFGSHTTPEKVSMESQNFKSIRVDDLKNLNVADVYEKIKENLN